MAVFTEERNDGSMIYFGWYLSHGRYKLNNCTTEYNQELKEMPAFDGLSEVIWTIRVSVSTLELYCQHVNVLEFIYETQDAELYPYCKSTF